MRELKFVGSSKKDLLAMPEDAIDLFGYALDRAQRGMVHYDAKPFKGYISDGVFEVVYDDGDAYRALYATRSAPRSTCSIAFRRSRHADGRCRSLIWRR